MKKNLAFLISFLLILAPASAIWESVPSEVWLNPGNVQYIGGLNVKVMDLDVEKEEATVVISEEGKKLFMGLITKSSGFDKQFKYKVKAEDFRYQDPVHPQVKINFYKWEAADIVSVNFPSVFYKSDAYKVFAVVKNDGKKETAYNLELSGENLNIRSSNKDSDVDYYDNVKKVVTSMAKEITLKPGKSEKVYFEVQRTADVGEEVAAKFSLKTNNDLVIKELILEPALITNEMTGYIEDLIVNQGMFSGAEETLKAKVRNSWIGASNDFYIKLIAPDFQVDDSIKNIRAHSMNTQEVSYRVTPYGGGSFTTTLELRIGPKLVDVLSIDIEVFGEKIYSISGVDAPNTMRPGDKATIGVTVENKNKIAMNTMSLTLESEDFAIKSPEHILRLSPDSKTTVMFDVVAKKEGVGQIDFTLYDTPEKFQTAQYTKKDKVADEESVKVKIGYPAVEDEEPEKEDVVEPKETEEEVVEDVEEHVEEVVPEEETTETEETEETTATTVDVYKLWPYAVVLALVVLALVLIFSGEKKQSHELEIYEVETKKGKKKKK